MRKKREVTQYELPPEMSEMVNIAEKRGMDIFRQWAWSPNNKIEKLIISLYLQGMNDVIDTIYPKK